MGIDFYTNPMSRGQIVRWMLEEVGALELARPGRPWLDGKGKDRPANPRRIARR